MTVELDEKLKNFEFDETLFHLVQTLNYPEHEQEEKIMSPEQENIRPFSEGVSQYTVEIERKEQFLQQQKKIKKFDLANNKANFWATKTNTNCTNTESSVKDKHRIESTLTDTKSIRRYILGRK